jgi:hypothetical protein
MRPRSPTGGGAAGASSLPTMLLRLRWLSLGMLLALSLSAVVATRLVRARRRWTTANVGRTAAAATADALDWAVQRLRAHRTPQG